LLLKIWDDFHLDYCWKQIIGQAAFLPSGFHTIEFDASDLASGIYFYELEADNDVRTGKMILLKLISGPKETYSTLQGEIHEIWCTQ
jgi:hypothetical protein